MACLEYPPKWCTYSATWSLNGWRHGKLLPSRRAFYVHIHTTVHQFTVSLHAKQHTYGACVFSCNLPPALLAEWPGKVLDRLCAAVVNLFVVSNSAFAVQKKVCVFCETVHFLGCPFQVRRMMTGCWRLWSWWERCAAMTPAPDFWQTATSSIFW